ncbi:MAG: NAD-dependent epimerase/dehydratase family protein [Pedosphaera sp.]|nr:NAD-dependent epimerase/dehydratase family protein [Pedosphaera sp.]
MSDSAKSLNSGPTARRPEIEADLAWIAAATLPWATLAGKTLLVSGANGFLPAYMVEAVLYLNEHENNSNPATVIALVRNRERALKRFSAYQGRTDLQFLVQDVCQPAAIRQDIHFIIHAASQASPNFFRTDPVGTLSANVLGTLHLLNLAREKQPEAFLFFSSGEVYGRLDSTQVPTQEDTYGYIDPTDVRSCYAESKRMGETMCVAWAHQYGVPSKIVRPFHTYGPGMRLDDGRVFSDFVADVVNHRNIVMKSDGSAMRAFCYLSDAVLGFFTVLLRGEIGQAYNVGNDRGELTIRDLAHLLVRLHPDKRLDVVQNEAAQSPDYLKSKIVRNCPDIFKIRQLGWEPIVSVDEGFKRTIQSFL